MSLIGRTFVTLLNHVLEPSGWARTRLAAFSGSKVCMRLVPLEVSFDIDQYGMFCEAVPGSVPDVVLSFSFADFPGLLSGSSAGAKGGVSLEGNAELADALGFVFRNLRWDAEEDLARIFGDIPARRLMLGMQSLKIAHDRTVASLGANFAEYFSEEQPLLVKQHAAASLSREMQALRDETARLEKRLNRLGHASMRPEP